MTSSYDSVKFSFYKVVKISHSKMGSINFDCPPSLDWGILVRIIRVIEYPKELRKSVDSWDGGDRDLVGEDDGVSCSCPSGGLS